MYLSDRNQLDLVRTSFRLHSGTNNSLFFYLFNSTVCLLVLSVLGNGSERGENEPKNDVKLLKIQAQQTWNEQDGGEEVKAIKKEKKK